MIDWDAVLKNGRPRERITPSHRRHMNSDFLALMVDMTRRTGGKVAPVRRHRFMERNA